MTSFLHVMVSLPGAFIAALVFGWLYVIAALVRGFLYR